MPYFTYNNKNIYYDEIGSGVPLILLHGNSLSSKMFNGIISLFKRDFKIIMIDFLGHGKSDRLEKFPIDFWYDQAIQVARLIENKGYGKVNIIGTSGGALTALNLALERDDLVNKVIADSFEGENSNHIWTSGILSERNKSKRQIMVQLLWKYCHGKDWEKVVDNDTDVIIQHNKLVGNFFHKDLATLKIPVLLSVSLKDNEYAEIMDIEKTYIALNEKIPKSELYLFEKGGHPAMITNAKKFANIAKAFFESSTT